MRRMALSALVMAVAVVLAVVGLGASGGDDASADGTYNVALDNAFGLIKGADVKVAGVRAGKVSDLTVRASDARALVSINLTEPGFTSLRSDVFCEIRPQSLIGEYFLDCQPGATGKVLAAGSTIPVTHTATTIPSDLVQNILRRPYRDRFRLIFSELGIALAARGGDVNETIRRAVPALRETNRVLDILSQNRFVIQALTRDADQVLARLAGNRTNVSRFVAEARDTAAVSARHRVALRATFRKLPGFLRQLRPTLRYLGNAATSQTPALRNLRASAPALTTFLQRLGPFADVSRPVITSLGSVSQVGRRVAVDARPTVAELRNFTTHAPELSQNLAIVLEHLDDRVNAVDNDPDSPNGEGYTGLEALLQYPFDQALAINAFDRFSHKLKINLIINDCGRYTNARTAREDKERTRRCSEALGPNQPGINTDEFGDANEQDDNGDTSPGSRAAASMPALSPTPPTEPTQRKPGRPSGPGSTPSAATGDQALMNLLGDEMSRAIGPSPVARGSSASDLLDFLLSP